MIKYIKYFGIHTLIKLTFWVIKDALVSIKRR